MDDPQWTLDVETGRALADIDRVLRERILLAADTAISEAIRKAGSRLRSKAQADPVLTARLRAFAVTEWTQHLANTPSDRRTQAFALGADLRFLLKGAWDALGTKFTTWAHSAIESVISKLLAMLRIKPDSDQGRALAGRVRSAMQSKVDSGWGRLRDGLDAYADKKLFDDTSGTVAGEQPAVDVPPFLVRVALAEIGGIPETSGGMSAQGTPLGEPLPGLTDGATVARELAQHGVVEAGREWRYNPVLERGTFHNHYVLDHVRFASWADPVLTTQPEDAWIGSHYSPGDHWGCLCSSVPAYAVPPAQQQPGRPGDQSAAQRPAGQTGASTPLNDPNALRDFSQALATQWRERHAQPSFYMSQIIMLAEMDDAAGRRGTDAQKTRNQWLHVQAQQRAYLAGE